MDSNSAFSAIVRLKIMFPKIDVKLFTRHIRESQFLANTKFNRTGYEKNFMYALKEISSYKITIK